MKKSRILMTMFVLALCVGFAQQSRAEDAPTASVTSTPIVSAVESNISGSWKGKKAAGVFGLGYFEINSDFESMYFSFPLQNTNTAGFGFGGYFEFGFSDKFSGQLDVGYARLVYASQQRNIIKENFFTIDATAHYHFLNNDKFDVYAILGVGTIVSGSAVAPVLDVGVGNYFKLSDSFSIKTELLFKSAIILNRGEARVGVAYHF